MKYKILDLSQKDEWNKYLNRLPIEQQDIYYTPEYYSLYENYGDGNAQCFVFEQDGEIALYPFLLNSINELGYDLNDQYYDIQGAYGYNGVISTSYNKDFIINFFRFFDNYCNQNKIIAEFCRFNPYLKNHLFSEKHIDVTLNRKTVLLDLKKDYDDIWENSYSSNNRNMIRKANKGNLKFIINNSDEGVRNFYKIYIDTMKQINAFAYYHFNQNMFKEMLNSDYFNFLFAKNDNGIMLATLILIIYGNYAHYHLSGRNLTHKDNSVTNFLLDEAVKLAKKNGAKKIHFGGGNTDKPDDSLLGFKMNFSNTKADFFIGKKVHNPDIYDNVIKQWESINLSQNKNNKMLLRYRELAN